MTASWGLLPTAVPALRGSGAVQTPAEAERLAMLAEECAEVIQITGKILKHGYDSYYPDRPHVTNRALLGRKVTDLPVVLHLMEDDFEALPGDDAAEFDRTIMRKLRLAHHQGIWRFPDKPARRAHPDHPQEGHKT